MFSREFGKLSLLAKGAKRLKGPFDAALDLLSTCRIVFISKSSGALGLLTQAKLSHRFVPVPSSLSSLYGAYYVADLLCGLTEDFDVDERIFDLAQRALEDLSDPACEPAEVVVQFEIGLLCRAGLFPDLTTCTVCGESVQNFGQFAHWVSQGGLLCQKCRKDEYAGRSVSGGSIAILRKLSAADSRLADRVRLTKEQITECHRLAVATITNVLGRKPGTLRYLNF